MSAPATPENPRIWTPLDLIKWTTGYFQKKGLEAPRAQAEWLLADVLKCDRVRLYLDHAKVLNAEQLAQYREFVRRRADQREPLQYILGHTDFCGLKLKTTRAALIPRPETEELAEAGLEFLRKQSGTELSALDIGTGTGCIALTLASGEPRVRVLATDLSPEALALARENAKAIATEKSAALRTGAQKAQAVAENISKAAFRTAKELLAAETASERPEKLDAEPDAPKPAISIQTEDDPNVARLRRKALAEARSAQAIEQLEQHVEFLHSDIFAGLPAERRGTFQLIISNPPYIDPDLRAGLQPELKNFEPAGALFAEEKGLAVLRRIISEAPHWLASGGALGLELSPEQAATVRGLLEAHGAYAHIEIRRDLRKLERFAWAIRK